MSLHNGKAYQIECPACRTVAGLHAKAGLLQAYINRVLPRSSSPHPFAGDLTAQQRGAVAWSLAISNCLRREMALHARCGACSILMGPGHAEVGTDGFCGTHTENAVPDQHPSVVPQEMPRVG